MEHDSGGVMDTLVVLCYVIWWAWVDTSSEMSLLHPAESQSFLTVSWSLAYRCFVLSLSVFVLSQVLSRLLHQFIILGNLRADCPGIEGASVSYMEEVIRSVIG